MRAASQAFERTHTHVNIIWISHRVSELVLVVVLRFTAIDFLCRLCCRLGEQDGSVYDTNVRGARAS